MNASMENGTLRLANAIVKPLGMESNVKVGVLVSSSITETETSHHLDMLAIYSLTL